MAKAFTHAKFEAATKRAKIDVLAFHKDLFCPESPILMPARHAGEDGSVDVGGVKWYYLRLMEGILTLAAAFKQYEFDDRKRMILVGRASSGGDAGKKTKLSEERAKSVLYLLISGKRKEWAKISEKHQKIREIKRLLKYYHITRGWDCNPGDNIDDNWNDNTYAVSEKFFKKYNEKHVPHISNDDFNKTKRQKKWPRKVWEAVYNLYIEDLRKTLKLKPAVNLDLYRMNRLQFINDKKKYVACGGSFPLSDDEKNKSKYNLKDERRVEILFFYKNDLRYRKRRGKSPLPPKITCPAGNKFHTENECPIWHKNHFIATLLNPGEECQTVAYHLVFAYRDRVRTGDGYQKRLPEGLIIKAYQYDDPGHVRKEIVTRMQYHDGVYTIKVKDDTTRKNIYFEFEAKDPADATKRLWIYTKDKRSQPKMVKKTDAEVAAETLTEQLKYYDLPLKWSSQNYWTRYKNNAGRWKGDRFQVVLKDKKKLKPWGDKLSKVNKYLLFSLDDIVLVDSNMIQNINNAAGNKPQDLDDSDNKVDLNASSRLTLFYLDRTKKYQLKIYKPRTAHNPYFSKINFTQNKNLIIDTYRDERLIVFCNGFYNITNKRTVNTPASRFKFSQDHILGARAAVLDDADVYKSKDIHVTLGTGAVPAAMSGYVHQNCGNYELHYLHKCGQHGGKPISYLIVYWNCRFKKHATITNPQFTAARAQWEKVGMTNSMTRTNRPYELEMKSGPEDIVIRLYHFYEAKLDGFGGKEKCKVNLWSSDADQMGPTSAEFYHILSHSNRGGYYGSDAYKDVDGKTYKPLMSHHEMGHATGLFDDYMYSLTHGGYTYSVPAFSNPYTAPGGPYSIDWIACMYNCRVPRMRDHWHFVKWLNDESNSLLQPFLRNSKYKMVYRYKRAGANKKVELDLYDKAGYRDTCVAYKHEDNFNIGGGTGKSDVYLYQLGGGETSITLDPFPNPNHVLNPRLVFNGILAVRTKVAIKFTPTAGHAWDDTRRNSWMQNNIETPIKNFRFYLNGPAGNDFRRTIIVFVPHFEIYTGAHGPADSHFDIEVTRKWKPADGAGAHGRRFHKTAPASKKLEVDNDVDNTKIIRYMFGKTAATAMVAADFNTLARWIEGKLAAAANSFSVRTLT